MRKILAFLLALTMAFSLTMPTAWAAEVDEAAVTVLYTNDVHTYIDKDDLNYAKLAAYKDNLENVLLVDAGDHIQGTAYGSMDKGETIIQLMNAAGYDLATLGNHEFDYGMDGRIKVTDEWAEFPYVSCNFYNEADGVKGETVLDAYKVFEIGGLKIAFIGITTPESFTKSTPAYFQDAEGNYIYGISGGEDGAALYADVQKAIDAASAEADVIIALGHLGDDPASQPWTSEEVIANTTGLDAFIDGHSHSTVESKEVADKAGNTVVLTQTGEYFGAIGQMSIAADGSISCKLVTELTEEKEDVKAMQDAWIAEIETQLGEVIGSTELTLDNYDAEGNRLVRKQETNTGDFAADALYYLFDNMDLDVDVAIMNGGGVRNKAVTGEISYLTAKSIHTFGNVACLQTITGQQLLDALEWGARDASDAECGGFLQVSGITYAIDTSVASTVQMDDKGVWTGGPTGEYRVKGVQIYNKETQAYEALDLTAKYNLAGYNYTLRDLGDGFAMFDGAVNVLDYVMEDYMVLANYVKAFEDGKVAATNSPLKTLYPNMLLDYGTVSGSGRIAVGPVATVLYTNDIHTYIDKDLNYANLAALKDSLTNALLVDAGDHIQGTAYGSMDKGKTIIDLMNAAGYDLATLGNHEFDYGMDGRIKVTDEWAEFPYVSCNFYNEADGVKGESVLDAYQVLEAAGLKIAFIGITTPESFTKSTPAYFQNEDGEYIYGISGGTDGAALYADVQAAIDAASAEADVVIALGHLGDDLSSQPWTSEEVIANTTGLDAFIDGHSHSTVESKKVADKDGNAVVLTQTGEYFGAIGCMTIDANGNIACQLITELDEGVVDEDVKAIQDAWINEIEAQLGQVIGSADVTLDNYDEEGNRLVRIQETNTGDFAADALYYLFDNMGLDVDFAIMNGGGVRNNAITGELTYQSCKAIHTFGNVACLQTITGQQMLDALEWGARQAPTVQVGGFLHVSGVTYEVDASIESTVQADDKGVWTGAPTGEYRVKNVQVYNKETQAYEPLDLTAEYNLAGYNYTLRDLGDGFAMFDGAVNVLDYVMEDYMVLANYVQAFPEAIVGADNSPLKAAYPNMLLDYSTVNGSGRIVIGNVGEEEWDGKIVIGGLDNNIWFTKYGNVYCDCTAENFVNELGLTWGDMVTVKFLDKELTLPVIPTYSYVDSGEPAIILEKNEAGNPTGYISMAINMGNFGETYGLAVKKTDADGNWYWEAAEGVTYPVELTFELAEKEGYMDQIILRDLQRTNNREDYAHLTDEEFANFRAIATTGMGENVLYRSSSPINPELGRNTYADAAAKKAGITVIMNLADSKEMAEAYEGFADTYYAEQNVIYLNLGVDFAAEDFQAGLAKGLKFFAENQGTYLVHCTEGKDRAGFVSALLECLMGASVDEVVADYMTTYENYYGVEEGSEKYGAIASSNIIKSLMQAFDVADLWEADLAAEAEEYIAAIGLSDTEIAQLKANLSGKPQDVTIIYTNDVHTYIDNTEELEDETEIPGLRYSVVAALKDSLTNALLVDAGDHIQGTAYGSMDKGKTIIDLMNAAGYDLATLGNHEFDYGMDGRINVTDEWANFPYVSANFYHELDGVRGENVLDAYKVFEIGGQKIAFVGITTPESFTKSTPAYFQNEDGEYIYGIDGGEDGAALYAAVQKAIDAASAEADVVIALGHLGDDPASQPWTSEELIANTTGLDAFIDGHSHSTVEYKEVADKNGDAVVLTQTGEYLKAIGQMTIKADGTIETKLLGYEDVAALEPDAETKAIEEAWISEIETKLGEVIGYTDVIFDNYDEEGIRLVRSMETNTGDFAADALYYLFDNMGLDVDFAIMNGGGVRSGTITGELSYLTAKQIHTFGNVACLQTITGQQLLDALEWGARNAGVGENGGFLQVSGIMYEIHTYIESTVQMDEKGVWTGGPTGEYRVKEVYVYDKAEDSWMPLDLEAEYNLAGYNYTLRDLGDGFAMFDGAVNVLDYVMEDYMVLANYIKAFEDGYVGADNSPLNAKYPSLWIDYTSVYGDGRIWTFDEPMEDIEEEEFYELNISIDWQKDEEADRPDSVIVMVKQNGEDYAPIELTAEMGWAVDVQLPLYDEDYNYYTYTYEVNAVDGYELQQKETAIESTAELIFAEYSEEGYDVYMDDCDVIMLVDASDMMMEEPGEVILWARDEAAAAELEAELDELVEEGVTAIILSGQSALEDLGGKLVDGVWTFSMKVDEAAGTVEGIVPVLGIKEIPVAVELEIVAEKKAADIPGGDETPDDEEKPDDEKPDDEEKPEDVTPPTGDEGVTVYAVMTLLTLCAGAALVIGKKKELF